MIYILQASCLIRVGSVHDEWLKLHTYHLFSGFRDHDLLNDLNPLTIKAIKIPSQHPNKKLEKLPKSVIRLGDFLLSLLRIEYEQKDTPIADLPVAQAVDNLKDQIVSYVKGAYPFELPMFSPQDPFEWWKRLDGDASRKTAVQPMAVSTSSLTQAARFGVLIVIPWQCLARGIFALTPNSMADERTQSAYTWLNSYLRNRQSVSTVTRMIQIRNHHRQERKVSAIIRH